MNTFCCDWRYDQGEYYVWWIEDVTVSAHSSTHQKAELAVADLLMARFPWNVPEIEYVVCPPVYEKFERLISNRVLLAPSVSVDSVENGIEHYFTGGACEGCEMPFGERNESELRCVAQLEAPSDAVRVFKRPGVVAFSQSFVRSVSKGSEMALTWLPVHGIVSPDGQQYFELMHQVSARAVSVDAEEKNGLRCGWCGRVFIASRGKQGQLKHFVDSESECASRLPVGFLGNAFWNRTILSEDVFRRLIKDNARRGIYAAFVGVASAKDQVADGVIDRWIR